MLRNHPLFRPYLALASVCFFWGTTYLAIRMAIETFPPLLLVGVRFTLSGTIMLAAAKLAGLSLPSRKDAFASAVFGILALGVGGLCLSYAELMVPSSLAALLVTTSPFWMIGIEAMLPNGEKLHLPTLSGMIVGLAGAAILVGPNAWREGLSGNVVGGFLLLQVGNISWGISSTTQRRHLPHVNVVVNGGLQQLAAGITFLIPALVIGQQPSEWSARGVGAVLYLVVFGSIVGYTSYVYALKKLPLAMVTLHNYINPVVAGVLGWLFYREPFGKREIVAMLVIFLGVAVVKRFRIGQPGARLAAAVGYSFSRTFAPIRPPRVGSRVKKKNSSSTLKTSIEPSPTGLSRSLCNSSISTPAPD